MSTTTEVRTITCRQDGEGESVFDCAIRHGYDAQSYRVGGGVMGAQKDGEEIAGYVKARPNDAPYPILRRAAVAKKYTIAVGATLVGETDDRNEAAQLLADARDMSARWASHYGQPVKLTEDGRTVDLPGTEGFDW